MDLAKLTAVIDFMEKKMPDNRYQITIRRNSPGYSFSIESVRYDRGQHHGTVARITECDLDQWDEMPDRLMVIARDVVSRHVDAAVTTLRESLQRAEAARAELDRRSQIAEELSALEGAKA